MIDKTKPTKLINFSNRSLDMIEAIMNQTGFNTVTAVVTRGIEQLYKDTFKYGADPLTKAQLNDDDTTLIKKAEIKAKSKIAEKDAELTAKQAPKIDMCVNLLGGAVEENENGHKFCRFIQYNLNGDSESLLPLMQVDPIVAETSLFMPSKEAIFRNREDVKEKFSHLKYNK